MIAQDNLTLRLVRLKASEEALNAQQQIYFISPTQGSGRFVMGNSAKRLAVGDILVVNSTVGGKILELSGNDFAFWCFSVSFENLLPLVANHEVRLLQKVIEEFKEAKLYSASGALAMECHRLLAEVPPQSDFGHRIQLLQIVFAVLSKEFRNALQQRSGLSGPEDHVGHVFESLSSNEILSLSVGELAARFCCSRRHLNRLFHQYFGLSVAKLKMEMRLIKAVSLLRNSDAKVVNVAEECGFNHQGLFTSCFKKRFGNSPGQWRKAGNSDRFQASHLANGNGNGLRNSRRNDLLGLIEKPCLESLSAPDSKSRSISFTKTPSPSSPMRNLLSKSSGKIHLSGENGRSIKSRLPREVLEHA